MRQRSTSCAVTWRPIRLSCFRNLQVRYSFMTKSSAPVSLFPCELQPNLSCSCWSSAGPDSMRLPMFSGDSLGAWHLSEGPLSRTSDVALKPGHMVQHWWGLYRRPRRWRCFWIWFLCLNFLFLCWFFLCGCSDELQYVHCWWFLNPCSDFQHKIRSEGLNSTSCF